MYDKLNQIYSTLARKYERMHKMRIHADKILLHVFEEKR